MKTKTILLIIAIILLGLTTKSTSAQSCINFQDTIGSLTIPTSQTNYGVAWYSNNGVTFSSQYFDWTLSGLPGNVNIQDHVASAYTGANGNSNFVGNIFFGYNTNTMIDFSGVAYASKKIEFDVNYILHDGSANPYLVNGQPITNLPTGITYTATPLSFGYHIVLTGNINTIEVHGQEAAVDNMCIESYITTPPCSVIAMFTYTANNSIGTFTNGSSVNAANATQLSWDFGDGTTSGDNDPIHTFGAPGVYSVCLTVVDMNCPNNPTAMFCDSVIIGNCQSGQKIITPNQDGLSDDVSVVAGSKIYDKNGFLVKNVTQNIKWAGKNNNNQDLPMGYYTIICPDNGVFNVTIVK
ncbi:MAG: PKD domain-containing protein [Vicingaceae bacterium]|nr:PKD domain-containing protein [Vicingaceae bacterium]